MPHLISIKNNSLILSKDEGMYVKFTITPPSTPCKINVKFVIEDIISQFPVEGIEMEINVKNTWFYYYYDKLFFKLFLLL